MTIIREFKIWGLAGRSELIHKVLNPTVNVLWGLNGSGKTTLLRILDAALENETSPVVDLPFERAEVTFYSEDHDVNIIRSLDRSKARDKSPRALEVDWGLLARMELDDEFARRVARSRSDSPWPTKIVGRLTDATRVKGLSFRHKYLPISRILEPVRPDRGSSSLTPDERFVQHVNSVWTRYSAQSLATIRDIQQFGLAEVLAILFGGISESERDSDSLRRQPTTADEAWDLVSEFLLAQRIRLPLGKRNFIARYDESDANRHVVGKIQSVMEQVDRVLEPQRELQSVIEEMYIGNKHLVLTRGTGPRSKVAIEVDEQAVPLASLSSGEKQLLHILLETLAIERSTIMIDEPELSLHVDWQKRLIESMRRVNPAAQFILATHSPELMVDVDAESVFEL